MQGLIGKKVGMTRVFDEQGRQVPVTVLQVGPCTVVQRKQAGKDRYEAVQLGFEPQKEQRLTKPVRDHFAKRGVKPMRVLREVRVETDDPAQPGDTVTVDVFKDAEFVDVTGVTKGRGFQGVVRRFGMSGGPAAHGSGTHRRPGSIGMNKEPSRVFKNRKLPGQMGNVRRTTQNLRVVKVLEEDHTLLVRGAVMGPNGGIVMVRKAIKKAAKTS